MVFKKGEKCKNWNGFKKGHIPWSKRMKGKYSVKHKGQFKKGNKTWNIGLVKETDERVRKYSIKGGITKKRLYKEGKIIHPMKGKKHTKETKKKISETKIKRYKEGKIKSWNKGKTFEESYGKKRSKDIREKMSKTRILKKIAVGKNNPFYGKTHTKEIKKIMSLSKKGDKSPTWNGGSSFEPYGIEFNKELKDKIRIKYGRICVECKHSEKELGYSLQIHHIDFKKKNNLENNLIPLCRSCHMKTRYNRKEWISYYQGKVIGV